jgi:hypothetical protein
MANITGDSRQAVAFALLEKIALAEDWSEKGEAQGASEFPWKKTKQEILNTYKECLKAVDA